VSFFRLWECYQLRIDDSNIAGAAHSCARSSSRIPLFLGELLSSRARLRFTSRAPS